MSGGVSVLHVVGRGGSRSVWGDVLGTGENKRYTHVGQFEAFEDSARRRKSVKDTTGTTIGPLNLRIANPAVNFVSQAKLFIAERYLGFCG